MMQCPDSDWKGLLRYIEAKANTPNPYTTQMILADKWNDIPGAELNKLHQKLACFLAMCISPALYRSRKSATGNEPDNGFEILRKYHFDYTVGSVRSELRTVDGFHAYNACQDMGKLAMSIREWNLVRLSVAQSLPDAHVMSRFMSILPDKLRAQIKDRDDITTFDAAWRFVERKIADLHDEQIADIQSAQRSERMGGQTSDALFNQRCRRDQRCSGHASQTHCPQREIRSPDRGRTAGLPADPWTHHISSTWSTTNQITFNRHEN